VSASNPAGSEVAAHVAANVAEVRERIASAARRAGRDPSEVRLVAATKTVALDAVAAAVAAGVADVGENRAQELLAKAPALANPPSKASGAPGPAGPLRWHFLGALQRNKVRSLSPWIWCWQSVDRLELGAAIARCAPGARVLVEVNLAGEPQKAGCEPGAAGALVDGLVGLGLEVAGLMAVPPASRSAADAEPRRWFATLRALAAELELVELSMGMTDDFPEAVEEGATIVRVGRGLFGVRPA
jgi:pyridoxal phosphate enzyme (YggS family)